MKDLRDLKDSTRPKRVKLCTVVRLERTGQLLGVANALTQGRCIRERVKCLDARTLHS